MLLDLSTSESKTLENAVRAALENCEMIWDPDCLYAVNCRSVLIKIKEYSEKEKKL